MRISVGLVMNLPFMARKEGKYFVSCCPVLDVWSQGETAKRAQENLIEAVRLFLIDCFERGTLDRVLKDCGFVPMKKSMKAKEVAPENEIRVPLPFVIDQALAQCRA